MKFILNSTVALILRDIVILRSALVPPEDIKVPSLYSLSESGHALVLAPLFSSGFEPAQRSLCLDS